jgi:large subunit ribosomal protein L18
MASNRLKRHKRIRKTISGTESRPRLAVFRSSKNLQAQLIDDVSSKTLLGMSTSKVTLKGTKTEKSKQLGKDLAVEMSKAKITEIVFDRGGYKYHGIVKALADSLREGGIKF